LKNIFGNDIITKEEKGPEKIPEVLLAVGPLSMDAFASVDSGFLYLWRF
jgi:hypothetical protein